MITKPSYPFLLILLMASCLLGGCGLQEKNDEEAYSANLFAMGTYMNLTAYGAGAEAALQEAAESIQQLDSLWSVTDEESEIYQVNHSEGQPVMVSEITADLIAFALEIAQQTDGALDPTIYPLIHAWGFINQDYHLPAQQEIQNLLQFTGYEKVRLDGDTITVPENFQLDLGAVGKGYTGDLISDLLKERGITSALLDIGGNIQMIGSKLNGSAWRLGMKNPLGEGNYGILEVSDCAVVTSGGYERYFTGEEGNVYWHILDPDTGQPADSGLLSVTIVAKEGILCDALSTAIFVMGLAEGSQYWRTHGGFDMLLMTKDGEIYLTEGIQKNFTLTENFLGKEIHVITS